MSLNDAELLEQQRQRRKRINKLKSIIIMTISIWMIVSFLAIIILSVQVVKLNYKIKKIENNKNYTAEENTYSDDTENIDADSEAVEVSNVVTGIDTEDNMASEDELHQVYLSFDCEPGENTIAILDELKKYNIKATFFVSGVDTDEGKEICKRIVDEGHTIGMHSYSNRYSTVYNSTEAFSKDLDEISKYITEATGVNSIFYRFPGGSSNKISNVDMVEFVKVLNSKSIKYFDWNVSAGDASGNYTVESVVSNVTDGVVKYKTSVVLLHDASDKSTTAEAIGPLVDALKNLNTELLPIDENTYVVQYIKANSVE